MKSIIKQLEIVFRHVVVYPILRLFLRNETRDAPITLTSVKKLLVLRDDGIGDMIVSTGLFRRLKQANPTLMLAVFASSRNAEIIRNNPFVDKVYVVYSNWLSTWREIRSAKAEQFDAVMNFVFNRTTTEGLLANYISPTGFKVGQGLAKYKFYFNRLLELDRRKKHMVEVLAAFVDNVFGTAFSAEALHPEIYPDAVSRETIDKFLFANVLRRRESEGEFKPFTVINFSAVDKVRRMSVKQTVAIVCTIRDLNLEVPVLIYPPAEHATMRMIIEDCGDSGVLAFPEQGGATLLDLASLIEGASYVVTCDTSIVHFASAMRTPAFVLYTPTAAKNHEWTPYGIPYSALYAELGEGVDAISHERIRQSLRDFLRIVAARNNGIIGSAENDQQAKET